MLSRIIHSGSLTLILCCVYAVVMVMLAPGFATVENARNVLAAMLPLLVVATGQTVVLITGGIDLSVTSIIALTSVAGAALITSDGGPLADSGVAVPAAVLVMIGLGCLIGAANGAFIAWLGMPPFIVTLTIMMFLSGFSVWWTKSEAIYNLPQGFLAMGTNLPTTLAITCVVAVCVHLMLSRTLLGKSLKAIGHNAETARVSGIHVARTTIVAYTLCGATAGVASILITGQLETGSPVQWENNLLDIIGATVIGGTSLYGGRGSVLWTAAGVLLLTLIDNSLNLLSLSYFTIMMAKGAVILLAALLDTLRYRVAGVSQS